MGKNGKEIPSVGVNGAHLLKASDSDGTEMERTASVGVNETRPLKASDVAEMRSLPRTHQGPREVTCVF